MTLVGNFITENARMARERCSAVCAALVPTVAALAALPGFEQQVPVCTNVSAHAADVHEFGQTSKRGVFICDFLAGMTPTSQFAVLRLEDRWFIPGGPHLAANM